MSLANGLPVLFILSKNQLLVLLVFAVFFISFSFINCSDLDDFLLLTLWGFCSLLVALVVGLGCLFDVSFVSEIGTYYRNYPLSTTSIAFHRFRVVFSLSFAFRDFLFSSLVSLVTSGLTRSILFSLRVFVFCIVFFPCSRYLILQCCG